MDVSPVDLHKLPRHPGTYVYRDKHNVVLYVGKARDLSKRVRDYFTNNYSRNDKTRRMVSQIYRIEVTTTPTEFDALLLEAQLIRKLNPKYNVSSRDDKSPLYIILTLGEQLPRILRIRKTSITDKLPKRWAIFGPFQSKRIAYGLLQRIRRVIPYCTQMKRDGKPCFYTHLGLCDPCPSYISKLEDSTFKKELTKRYRRSMIRIRDIFSGRSSAVIEGLQKEMETLAKKDQFEAADRIKQSVVALIALQERRFDPMVYTQKDSTIELVQLRALLQAHIPKLEILSRIECIDVSNIAGHQSTGSLVVLTNGVADPSQYRRFHNKTAPQAGRVSDVEMIKEVLARRLRHTEWEYPSLLVVDGGKSQVSAAAEVLEKSALTIPLIGLAKRFETIILKETSGKFRSIRLPLNSPAIHVLQRIRDEAHRFAKAYHLLLRRKLLDTMKVS